MFRSLRINLLATFLLAPFAPVAVAGPATQPSTEPSPQVSEVNGTSRPSPRVGGVRPGLAYVIQRYKRAVAQLTLTEDQKPKVEAVFDHASEQGRDLSASFGDAPQADRFQKLIAFGKDIRQQLSAVLTADQMTSLDQKLSGAFNRPGGAPTTQSTPLLDNLQRAIAGLDLTQEQKNQVKDLLAATRQKLIDIRKNPDANLQQQYQQVRTDLRQKLQAILSPDQMRQLGSIIQQRAAGAGRRPGAAGNFNQPVADNRPADLDFSGPEVGAPAPSTPIIELNGRAFNPSAYKGHVVVLEFGSMSCPVFRQHVPAMEKLKSAETGRAFFLLVYTREAFPAGEKNVERNRDDGISIPQASSLDERKSQATETQRELRITIPIAVDSMSDAVSNAFGGFPNAAVVIGKDGKIAAYQQWTNPDTLKGMIDDAANAKVDSSGTGPT